MEKHLILVDLDGTLLKKNKTIGEMSKQAIREVLNLGHEVIIITGRAHYRSHQYYEELNLTSLFVNRNAGYIHLPSDINFTEMIETIEDDILEIIVSSEIYPLLKTLYFEVKNDLYVLKGTEEDYAFYSNYPLCKIIEISDYKSVNHPKNLISLSVDLKHQDEIKVFLDSIPMTKYEIFIFNEMAIFHVYPHITDKYNALKTLSEYYNVPNERIIAFGDAENDILMIKEAGIGVAMNNSIQEVKEVANIVLEYTNEEDGVGLFLKQYFKLDI